MPYLTSVERIGFRKGLLSGIEKGLGRKFGDPGLSLLAKIAEIPDEQVLEALLDGLWTVQTLEDLRQIYRA